MSGRRLVVLFSALTGALLLAAPALAGGRPDKGAPAPPPTDQLVVRLAPGSTLVHGVSNPSAMIVCVRDVSLRNAMVCPARMLAGSGVATTHEEFALEGVSVTTRVAG